MQSGHAINAGERGHCAAESDEIIKNRGGLCRIGTWSSSARFDGSAPRVYAELPLQR